MKQITFSCRIVCDKDDGINPVHLCEEIQAYLNSGYSYCDDELQEHVNAEVVGYRVEEDNYVPFIAQEEY